MGKKDRPSASSSSRLPRASANSMQLNLELANHFELLAQAEMTKGDESIHHAKSNGYSSVAKHIREFQVPITGRAIGAKIRGIGKASLDIIDDWLKQRFSSDRASKKRSRNEERGER